MRPKGSGYRSQSRLLEAMRQRDICFQEAADILRSRGGASRNLKALVAKKLSRKYKSGHKTLYAVTGKGKRWTEWEGKQFIKRLLAKPPWHETPEGKQWLSRLSLDYDETIEDYERDRLWKEYRDEISELLKIENERLVGANVYKLIAWAKELRRWRAERRKLGSRGAREPRIEPYTKIPRRFKPSE